MKFKLELKAIRIHGRFRQVEESFIEDCFHDIRRVILSADAVATDSFGAGRLQQASVIFLVAKSASFHQIAAVLPLKLSAHAWYLTATRSEMLKLLLCSLHGVVCNVVRFLHTLLL